ncbi:DNA-directed RNA polymerase sigma-70 factor [Streptomyces albiflavescens]|uniref:DNA-directed RNA polymerase sigma-70 factor n=1 Tax=Streptomyces albiflavescens TaxID=1623582 RepID=A0A918D8M6_9ACTN|nr:RNA polymerase sigma factor [Streptomyces albiflavescens]GGN85239.1 DNA-directed RNA polymerase sigma-70 factor [Streptomyces albiflavescens]
MTASPSVGVHRAVRTDAHSDSDASVIERSWDEPDAFAVLFDRYADDIHRYAARRLGTEAADDLMAETFVIAFQRRRRYDLSRPQARPWLYGIVTNLVGQHRRAEARRLRALSRVAATAPGEGSGGEAMAERVADRVSAESARAALAGALAKLPARYRDVLLVIAWGDLDYTEAAEALGVPVGTVRSRLHRARSRLREALGGSDPTALQEVHEEPDHA